jgi:hypothetical protein
VKKLLEENLHHKEEIMDNLELQLILEDAYKKTFLDKIEFLVEHDREYKKSEFFKLTKIPLLTLYEKFDQYKTKSITIVDEFIEFIQSIDTDMVAEKVADFITSAEQNKKIVDTINDIIENFNYEKITKIAAEVQEELNKLK